MRNCLLFFLTILTLKSLYSQEPPADPTGELPPIDADSAAQSEFPADLPPIPAEYRGISLGMPPDEVKALLSEDLWFDYRGEPDVSMLEHPRESLIDVGGSLFLSRGLFQFQDGKLSVITLEMNPETIDWFTVFTTLSQRYGEPTEIDPAQSQWVGETTILSLERPLTIKYLDRIAFESILSEEFDQSAWRERARDDFLDEF